MDDNSALHRADNLGEGAGKAPHALRQSLTKKLGATIAAAALVAVYGLLLFAPQIFMIGCTALLLMSFLFIMAEPIICKVRGVPYDE